MARKFGKWLGGTMGWAFGGPIGALVGFSLGYLWDNATLEAKTVSTARESDFTISLLVLAAAVMKADQRVLRSELDFVKRFLVAQFGAERAGQQLLALKDLLERDIALAPVCHQIREHMSHPQRLQLLHFLAGIASADGEPSVSEWHVLQQIANYLHISRGDLESISAMFAADDGRYYRILEIPETATADEIKAAYRKMAKKYHPDRLGDVDEEVRKSATEKFRQVQEAYEKLTQKKNT